MLGKKIITASMAIVMILSGLVITTVGMDSEQPEINSNVDVETTATVTPSGGKRVVHAEDFTNWACGPCASHNPLWEPAIANMGYDKVAPGYTHVDWPSSADPVNNYGTMNLNANIRKSMYGISGVPSPWIDGENVRTTQPSSYYEAIYEARLAYPSDIKITTNGTINGGTRAGEVNIRVEALVDIPAGDYRLITHVWEDNINLLSRFGSNAANGETDWKWVTWFMLPDQSGDRIWEFGASRGDFLDFQSTFTADPTWDLAEMGATVFVQDFVTYGIMQSKVDLFQGVPPAPPTDDLVVYGKDIETSLEATKPYTMTATIYNVGSDDQTNVQVDLTLNGGTEQTQIVPLIESDHSVLVAFDWFAPATAGGYTLGFDVAQVPGETNVVDNIWTTPISVTYQSDIWTTPTDLISMSSSPGGTAFDNLTIGNTGTANLDLNINIGQYQDTVGNNLDPTSGSNRFWGNVYHSDVNTTIWNIEMYLDISSATPLYFYVYESATNAGAYDQILEINTGSVGLGAAFYSSGPVSTPMKANYYYYIFTAWAASSTYYDGNALYPDVSFGTCIAPMGGSGAPPVTTPLSLPYSEVRYAPLYQRLTTGRGAAPWLSVNPMSDSITPTNQNDFMLTADAGALSEGLYQTNLIIPNDDLDEPFVLIDVDFYVISESNDLVMADMDIAGNVGLTETLWINGTVENQGWGDETNVNVQFLVDMGLEDSTIIPNIPSASLVDVSFQWTVPIGLSYDLTLYVVPVAGETVTDNNWFNQTLPIPAETLDWISPGGFDFVVPPGQVDYDNITVGNDGTLGSDYSITLGSVTETFGNTAYGYSGGVRDRGNVFHADIDTTIIEIEQYLNIATSTSIYFFVYEGLYFNGEYTKIAETFVASSGTGLGFYSSGPMSIDMTAGMYYYIGASWLGIASYYKSDLTAPHGTSFGTLESGQPASIGEYPPASAVWFGYKDQGPYYQRITTGGSTPSWLSVNPISGAIAQGTQTDCMLTIDTGALPLGDYQTNIYVMSSDPNELAITVSVNLTVGSVAGFDIPVSIVGIGWEFISFPIGASGDVTTILDDSINGDSGTTWDVVQWYDAQTQEWMSYATYMPASLNNMPVIDNTMGVWVHITANGGDGVLSTGEGGDYSGSAVDIDLYAGWNLVGYPSATPRFPSMTLPPQADMVAFYNIAQPYGFTDLPISTITQMQEGNAHWVHVTADCTWTVDP